MNPDEIPKTKTQLESERQMEDGQNQPGDVGKRYFRSRAAGATIGATPAGKALNRLGSFVGKKKKPIAIGSGVFGTLIGLAFFISSLVPFQLVNMMEVMQIQTMSITDRTHTRRSIRFAQQMFHHNRQYTPRNQRPVRRQVNRHLRNATVDNRIANIDARMNRYGLSFETFNGRPIGIRNRQGRLIDINPDNYRTGDGRTLTQYMDEVAPDRKLGQRTRFHQTINSRIPGGWVRKIFTGKAEADRASTKARIRDAVNRRVRGETSGNRVNLDTRDPGGEELERSVRNGNPDAVRTSLERLNGAQFLGIGCVVRDAARAASTVRKTAKYAPYLAWASTSMTAADSLKTGGATVHPEEVGAFMEFFHDHENDIHFDQSETWKRASGQGEGGTPLNPLKRFDDNSQSTVERVTSLFDSVPGGRVVTNTFCRFITSYLVDGGMIAACGPGAPACAIAKLVEAVVTEIAFRKWGPEIIDWMVGMMLQNLNPCSTGDVNDPELPPDPPDQLFNCLGAGMTLADTEHNRSVGALPLNDGELDGLERETSGQHVAYQQSRGFAWRWFSPENPYSVTAKVAMSLPTTASGLAKNMASLPGAAVKSLANVVPTVFGYGYQYDPEFDYYGISDGKYPQFGFLDEEVDEWTTNEGDWYNKVYPTDTVRYEVTNPDTGAKETITDTIHVEGSTIDLLTYYCWHSYGVDEDSAGNKIPWTIWHDNEGNSGPKTQGSRGQPCNTNTRTVDEGGNTVTANKHNMAYNSRGWPKADSVNRPEVGFIQCTQTPYFEAEELDCFGDKSKFDRQGTSHLPRIFTKNISAYMLDRYIVDNNVGVQTLNKGKQAQRTFHFLNGPGGNNSAPSLGHCVESNKFVKKYIDIVEFQVRTPPAAYCYVDESRTGPNLARDSFDPRDYEPNGFLFSEDPYEELPRSVRTGTGGGEYTGKLPTGSAAELARKILDSGKVTGSDRYIGQIQRVADGQPPCDKEGAYLSETLLGMILALTETYSFHISSLNRYCTGFLTDSGTGSYHYGQGGGRAVDFNRINGQDIITTQTRNLTKQLAEDAARMIPQGSGIGQSDCGLNLSLPPGIRHFTDKCNHIHIQVVD